MSCSESTEQNQVVPGAGEVLGVGDLERHPIGDALGASGFAGFRDRVIVEVDPDEVDSGNALANSMVLRPYPQPTSATDAPPARRSCSAWDACQPHADE